jgi:hypothetical protein
MRDHLGKAGVLIALSLHLCGAQAIRPRVIYGADDRLDYYQLPDGQVKRAADATVMLIRASALTAQGPITHIQTSPYGHDLGLCQDEPFYEQEKAGFCSGFLIAPDTVVTAGHCIRTQSDCDAVRFVFDFKLTAPLAQPHEVPTDSVFSCARLVHSVSDPTGEDFAVVILDRPVTHVPPLAFRQSGRIGVGEGLLVIGYPWGLPLKVAAGAQVRSVQPTYLQSNLDTYAGNSGSAVLNSATGDVEGILVRGESDYDYTNGCRASKRCPDTGCRGEDVTLFERVVPYLNN